MTALPAVVAVDWGTSRMRAWLLDATGRAIAEHRSDAGMSTARTLGFAAVLERALSELRAPDDIPAIICGMAGARQGWIEAPYVDVPSPLGAILRGAVRVPGTRGDIRIVPGLAQRSAEAPDVMRGEETQLAGAGLGANGRHLVCMPGTHSKWVSMENGLVTAFRTWPTGELFEVLASHSILRHSLGDGPHRVAADDPAFLAACRTALAEGGDIAARLFAIRAGGLLHGVAPAAAAASLSGLLIGGEVASATRHLGTAPDATIVLVASGALASLQRAALTIAGFSVRPVEAEVAVRAGLFAAARENGLLFEGNG